jgi:hypothetical protein
MNPTVQWQTGSPLWSQAMQDDDHTRFRQPAILRFANDAFMDELETKLGAAPASLGDLVARYETWESAPAEAAGWQDYVDFDPDQVLKLYQPVHLRFYLVTANLVCRLPGLPDKPVDTANEESVAFVLRRLVPKNGNDMLVPSDDTTYAEYSRLAGTGWVKMDPPYDRVANGEERLPLFGMTYGENGRQRRLLAGFLPVSGRENYQASPEIAGVPVRPPDVPPELMTDEDPLKDLRMAQFETTVVVALEELLAAIDGTPIHLSVDQVRDVLVFALLDLMTFLEEHLTPVWQAVLNDSGAGLSPEASDLFQALSAQLYTGGPTWDELLRDVWDHREDILLSGTEDLSLETDALSISQIKGAIDGSFLSNLTGHVEAALNEITATGALLEATTGLVAVAQAPEVPKIDPGEDGIYVVRCVYDRPRCKGLVTPLVSPPSQAFVMAPFFDPEAPVRPLRITMPVDTSIAGLKKFPKNVSFLISNELRKQMERVQGVKLGDLDDGELGTEPNINLGMICSLSIPIITICALILLMIIVQLLNIVFWWLPLFKICFPLNLSSE